MGGSGLALPPLMSLDKAPPLAGLGSLIRALSVQTTPFHSSAKVGAGELGDNSQSPLPVSVALDQTLPVTVPLLPHLWNGAPGVARGTSSDTLAAGLLHSQSPALGSRCYQDASAAPATSEPSL